VKRVDTDNELGTGTIRKHNLISSYIIILNEYLSREVFVAINLTTHLVFVEKKEPFNVEANHLLHELRTNLGIKDLINIRTLIKYVVKNVDHKTFTASLNTIFSEPPVDNLYLEQFPKKPQENAFGVMFLSGQFDQRADSAEQCLKLINPKLNPSVSTAVIYVLDGKISNETLNQIKKYLINPVDSQETEIYAHAFPSYKDKVESIKYVKGFCS
jgi:phosphoribosylformylglycinamidine synthase